MRCLVTGCAGFIGSHLAERLIRRGDTVAGVDSFADFYPRPQKEANLAWLRGQPGFSLAEADLARADLEPLLDGVEVVFHLAAQAGVRTSWGDSFRIYSDSNVLATQRLLEASRRAGPARFVYASSSSVYGQTRRLPMREDHPTAPFSPYGVSKLAGEHLVNLYQRNFGLPSVVLRFFTVFGPRQRPDMAFHRFLRAALEDRPIEIYGDGEQTRDFTFVDDVVEALCLAAERGPAGGVYNIGGGNRTSMNGLLAVLEEVAGGPLAVRRSAAQKGDMRHTYADIGRASRELGFAPRVGIQTGLAAESVWLRDWLASGG